MADLYLNTSNDINVDVTAEEGCADDYLEDYNLPIHEDSIHTDTSLQDTAFIGTNVIDHSIIQVDIGGILLHLYSQLMG